MLKRFFDVAFSFIALLLLAGPMLIIAAWIKWSSPGPVIYWSDRVGKDNELFSMPKFRTMRVDAPQIASHLLEKPDEILTPVGSVLRRYSLDELPQLFSIIKGDMSIVGPRPALYNQQDLIDLRTQLGIHVLLPGLTGWAQVNGRDELAIPLKGQFDRYYLENHSLMLDILILKQTFTVVLEYRGVHH